MNIAASTVSHHIKELRQAGIIVMERRGKNIECWVNEEVVQSLRELLRGGQLDSCRDMRAKRPSTPASID